MWDEVLYVALADVYAAIEAIAYMVFVSVPEIFELMEVMLCASPSVQSQSRRINSSVHIPFRRVLPLHMPRNSK
jgi:hypothetical protein